MIDFSASANSGYDEQYQWRVSYNRSDTMITIEIKYGNEGEWEQISIDEIGAKDARVIANLITLVLDTAND